MQMDFMFGGAECAGPSNLEEGTEYDKGQLVIKGRATSTSIRACYQKGNLFPTIAKRAEVIVSTARGDLKLADRTPASGIDLKREICRKQVHKFTWTSPPPPSPLSPVLSLYGGSTIVCLPLWPDEQE